MSEVAPYCDMGECYEDGVHVVGKPPNAHRLCKKHYQQLQETPSVEGLPIRPRTNWVVLEQFMEEEMTAGGLIKKAPAHRTKLNKGKVLAIGPGRVGETGERIPIEGLVVGDIVYWVAAGGTEFDVYDLIYFLVPADNIVLVETEHAEQFRRVRQEREDARQAEAAKESPAPEG